MRRTCTALALSTLLLSLSGCATDTPRPAAALTPASVSSTLPAPTGQPPAAGTVDRGPGPFDDRFTLTGLTLENGAVTGSLDITSDVSEIIVLEVHAAFYDAAGALLGTQVQVHQPDHGNTATAVPDESVPVSVLAAAAYRSKVSAARVTVPVLVNE